MTEAVHARRAARGGTATPLARSIRRALSRLRGRSVYEGAALLLPILLVGASHVSGPALWVAAAAYLGLTMLASARGRARSGGLPAAAGWGTARVLASIAMVAAGQLLTGVTGLLAVVYLPIIAVSAFASQRLVAIAVVGSIGAHWTTEAIVRDPLEALQRSFGFAAIAMVTAWGARREVTRMQGARARLRRALIGDRRRARQIAGVEAIGRILARRGPTAAALDEVVGRIAGEFGYRYVSIYLGHDRHSVLGAQRGYAKLVASFDGTRGIVGRVMRTHRPVFVPDVVDDADYWSLNADVRSEICVPLLAEDEFLGFVNVESVAEALDVTDVRVMVAVADRLAAALIIGRDRQQLAERADLFRHLHEFSEAVNGTLQPEELYAAIVRSVSHVVPADIAALHVLDRESGRYLLAAVEGRSSMMPGSEVRAGDGMAGRAIRDRAMVIDASAPRPPGLGTDGAPLVQGAAEPEWADEPEGAGEPGEAGEPVVAAAVPLIRDGGVLGALTLTRADRSAHFSDIERDALAMIGEQSALAVTNVFLHAEVADLALRDPLTGLFNRRYLDPALEQLFARRARLPEEERVPLAAIMFDLDRFSEFNNLHGHQVGDAVLRMFSRILQTRLRSTDLVARFGGEEFCAILYRAELDDATRIADEVRAQLASTPVAGSGGEELFATVSAGCATVGPDETTPAALLRATDVALYMAKRAGRNRVCAA